MTKTYLKWPPIVARAETICTAYRPRLVTLRQVFYRLVAEQRIPNTIAAYHSLSDRIVKARRSPAGFPDLLDETRATRNLRQSTVEPLDFARRGIAEMAAGYQRHRQDGQAWQVWIGVEKGALAAQVADEFEDLDIPVLVLRGFSSDTYKRIVQRLVRSDPRPSVLFYVGDYDPSGLVIPEDFRVATGCWDRYERIALTREQVEEFALPRALAKEKDSRTKGMLEATGEAFQVEAEALDPDVLIALIYRAHAEYFDQAAFSRLLNQEKEDRALLTERLGGLNL